MSDELTSLKIISIGYLVSRKKRFIGDKFVRSTVMIFNQQNENPFSFYLALSVFFSLGIKFIIFHHLCKESLDWYISNFQLSILLLQTLRSIKNIIPDFGEKKKSAGKKSLRFSQEETWDWRLARALSSIFHTFSMEIWKDQHLSVHRFYRCKNASVHFKSGLL